MKKRFVLLVAGSAVLVATAAYAAQIVSPMLPTSVDTSAACYVRNTGNQPVSVNVQMFGNNGVFVNFDNCNGSALGAGRTCVLLAFDPPDDSYIGCSVTGANVAKVRGTLELRQINPILKVIASQDLR